MGILRIWLRCGPLSGAGAASCVYSKISDLSSNVYNQLATKEQILSFNAPLSKPSNSVSINLSSYVLKTSFDTSFNSLNSTKQNAFTCISPLIKNDVSNNISIDLSAYPLKIYVDGSLNTINTTLNTKQNISTFSTPMNKDVSNNVTIDLSAYALNNSLNASNITSGTLSISRGGIGKTTLSANQILIGNAATSILQSANLTWNNTTNTLSATNFVGSNTTTNILNYIDNGISTALATRNLNIIGDAAVVRIWRSGTFASPTSGGKPMHTACTLCTLCTLFKTCQTTENKTLEFRSRKGGDGIRPFKLTGIRRESLKLGRKGSAFNV